MLTLIRQLIGSSGGKDRFDRMILRSAGDHLAAVTIMFRGAEDHTPKRSKASSIAGGNHKGAYIIVQFH